MFRPRDFINDPNIKYFTVLHLTPLKGILVPKTFTYLFQRLFVGLGLDWTELDQPELETEYDGKSEPRTGPNQSRSG